MNREKPARQDQAMLHAYCDSIVQATQQAWIAIESAGLTFESEVAGESVQAMLREVDVTVWEIVDLLAEASES